MNKKLQLLIALVLVAGVAYWLISRQPWSTMGELKDFSIKDTSSITKMFFADKRGHSVLLQRDENNVWMVNNKFVADLAKVQLMLATMHDVEVRNPITDNEHNNVISILATDGIKAEYYSGKKLIKTIYVGSSTPDLTGTYMLVDGSSKPFVTHINGFVGYLTPRFITSEKLWKNKIVFNVAPDEIKSISVNYFSDPHQSFVIENGALPVIKQNNIALNGDQKFLKYYLACFQNMYFEGYSEAKQQVMDSVKSRIPFCVIDLTKKDGKKIKLQVNIKAIDKSTLQQEDEHGTPLPYDTERYFAFINDEKDMVLIQQHVFGKIFRTPQEFLLKENARQ